MVVRHYMSSQSSIITVQQHIMREQKRFPGASGEFSFLLSGITLATKMIQAQVRRAGLTDVLGEHGDINVQGEVQQKLDILSNEALVHCLSARESIGVLASEENENPMIVHEGSEEAKYAVFLIHLMVPPILMSMLAWGQPSQFYVSRMMLQATIRRHGCFNQGVSRLLQAMWFTDHLLFLSTVLVMVFTALLWILP